MTNTGRMKAIRYIAILILAAALAACRGEIGTVLHNKLSGEPGRGHRHARRSSNDQRPKKTQNLTPNRNRNQSPNQNPIR